MSKQRWQNRIIGHADVAPGKLTANPLNFRKHPEHQQRAMEGALEQIGWIQDVIVNKRTGRIVDGHLRVELAIRRGVKSVPVKYVNLTDAEERTALATLDPISALAETDRQQLSELLGTIAPVNTDLQGLIDGLAKTAGGIVETTVTGATDDDAAPAVNDREPAISQAGDVWLLGNHRLIVGDSTDEATIARLTDGCDVDLLLTDPPYNVAYGETPKDKLRGNERRILNDDMGSEEFADFLTRAFRAAAAHAKPGCVVYCFHADTERVNFELALVEAGWSVRQNLIWVKHAATLSRQDYNWRHEPILYGWKEGAAHYFAFDFTETTTIDNSTDVKRMARAELEALAESLLASVPNSILYADKPSRSTLHPTMKPVELLARLMSNSTRRGGAVLDPFGGSGSTLIAAAKLQRIAYLCELDPLYADVICRRWQEWSGGVAVHEASGQDFARRIAKRA